MKGSDAYLYTINGICNMAVSTQLTHHINKSLVYSIKKINIKKGKQK